MNFLSVVVGVVVGVVVMIYMTLRVVWVKLGILSSEDECFARR